MFTGIIKEVGTVTKVEPKGKTSTIEVKTNSILKSKNIGESIAINGACMTITEINKNTFQCDIMQESTEKTNLNTLNVGSRVNLEPSITFNQALDGHLVQGHVDTTAKIFELKKQEDRTRLIIKYSEKIAKYLAFKGSITVNGVSLTISDLNEDTFGVDLIPHTLKNTNLGDLKKGDSVNLEVDLVARYLERISNQKDKEANLQYLKERNLI